MTVNEESLPYTDSQTEVTNSAPLYFIDNLGVNLQSEGLSLGIVSELSVTKLSLLALCPKKFYYSQILKLDEDIDTFYKDHDIEVSKRVGTSDAQRGTRVHKEIENYINGKEVKITDFDTFDFIKNLIDKEVSAGKELNSETEIKFSFFGQMVTGIPDLFISEKDVVLEVWDFKTGECFEDDKTQYFYQLQAYAYGLQSIGYKVNETIRLSIVLVDSKEIVTKELSMNEIKNELYHRWLNLSDLSTQKLDHCEICLYGNLCHKQ